MLFCDFSKPKYEECVKSIDEKDTNFHPTANFSIIGLYNKDELVEIYKDPLMKEIQGIFDAYVDTIYEMLKWNIFSINYILKNDWSVLERKQILCRFWGNGILY